MLATASAARAARDIALKTQRAQCPAPTTLEDFDCASQPSIDERQSRELAPLRFVAQGENVRLLGPPGVGTAHLASALGMRAIGQGLSGSFLTVADLRTLLARDARADRRTPRLQALARPKRATLDEPGSFPPDRRAARFLCQRVSRRSGTTSLSSTSNQRYGEWGDLFADQVRAAAILDRLLHHPTTVDIRGRSDRRREQRQAGVFHDLTAAPQEGCRPAERPCWGRPLRRLRGVPRRY